MAVATYTSDLTLITSFDATTSISAYGGGAGGLGVGADYAIENALAVDKQVSAAEKGFLYDNTSNFTIGADDHFFIWLIVGTPGIADTRDNRGIVVGMGDSTSAFVKFHVNGNDTLPLGGLVPYAIRFNNTALTNRRTLVGSPGTTPSWIGGGANITATAKFSNFGADVARQGTGYDVLLGTGADPEANFAGIAADDESTAEGIFQTASGGFKLQGKLRIGSASTACEFLDSNTNIFLVDTLHSLHDFTEILVENASSILTLTNVTFITLGTLNRGRFEMLTSTATLTGSNVGFIDFGETQLNASSTLANSRWVGSDRVFCDGADISGSAIQGFEHEYLVPTQDETSFDNSPTTEGTFVAGTGYAVSDVITLDNGATITVDTLSGSAVATFTVTTQGRRTASGTTLTQESVAPTGGTGFTLTPDVDNLESSAVEWNTATNPSSALANTSFTKGTAPTHAIEFGTTSPLNMTLTNVTLTGYNASDAAKDSALWIRRTSGTVTITISGGTTPSYKTDGATVVISSNKTVTFTGMKDNTEVRVYTAGTTTELAGIETATTGTTDDRSFAAAISGGTNTDIMIHNVNYESIRIEGFSWPTSDQDFPISQRLDRNFSNP